MLITILDVNTNSGMLSGMEKIIDTEKPLQLIGLTCNITTVNIKMGESASRKGMQNAKEHCCLSTFVEQCVMIAGAENGATESKCMAATVESNYG